ncbi:MAG TPA: outer membrane lipoprotein carrier protein LolA [Trueperaceae bacterium]|nr:outer membrane lipoprotein carrier protein LolA [Trueperaceae bacterium]HRQ11419.1 outer membrane lipoprotein carrier protein LolA [Trueperaceae bacterium]
MDKTMPQHRGRSALARTWATLGALALLAAPAFAQPLDVDTVLDKVASAARGLQDAAFTLTGKLIDTDGTTIALEIEIQVVPPQSLAKAYIIQPDALADNEIVLDGDAVYNYTFLTNQVMIFDADDPDALGGLLPKGEDGASAEISFDLGTIFAGFDATLESVEQGPNGDVYVIDFVNKDPTAQILNVTARVDSSDWLPRQLVFTQSDGHVLAELNAEDLVTNQGLDPAEVRHLPDDAEVIDNRR